MLNFKDKALNLNHLNGNLLIPLALIIMNLNVRSLLATSRLDISNQFCNYLNILSITIKRDFN